MASFIGVCRQFVLQDADVSHEVGLSHSSVEISVMGMERRAWVIQLS